MKLIRFAIVGGMNTGIDFTVFFVLAWSGIPTLLSQIIAYTAGTANSYLWNRSWTFQVHNRAGFTELIRFLVLNAATLACSTALLYVLEDRLGMGLVLSKVAATAVSMVLNYIGSRLWVFKVRSTDA
ncbi:GtrA family protein [Paenibacillus sp. GCM10023252]|uniref:GtrA family protein n=1 Tax=Paenibacillus sp. GCM10023252 TaxID=3252649 RepID=UPI00361BD008